MEARLNSVDEKESLAYVTARREVPALVSAADAHFGSWGKVFRRRQIR